MRWLHEKNKKILRENVRLLSSQEQGGLRPTLEEGWVGFFVNPDKSIRGSWYQVNAYFGSVSGLLTECFTGAYSHLHLPTVLFDVERHCDYETQPLYERRLEIKTAQIDWFPPSDEDEIIIIKDLREFNEHIQQSMDDCVSPFAYHMLQRTREAFNAQELARIRS